MNTNSNDHVGVRSSATIRAEIDALTRNKDAIQAQLNEAKTRARSSGVYADGDWFRRAETASKMVSRKVNRLQAELGQVLRAERQTQHVARIASFEQTFLRTARGILPRETYEHIVREAQTAAPGCASATPRAAQSVAREAKNLAVINGAVDEFFNAALLERQPDALRALTIALVHRVVDDTLKLANAT